jgi:gliding motility-associated-like protein
LDVLENPGINPNNINVPESICVGSTESVSSSIAQGTGQGQPITYQWSNAGAQTFSISGSGSSVNISVNTDAGIPDDGLLAFSITDAQGCSVDTTYSILIYELPVMGTLTVDPLVACSGDEIAVEMTGVTVDDGLDPNDVEYTWSGTIATGGVDFMGAGNSVIAVPEIEEVAFQDFVAPEELELGLTISIAGCESSASWTSQVDIYPGPERTADNTLVCTDQEWEATVTGCEVLTVYGQNGLPDITWTTADPAVGMDIVLPYDYLLAPSGQTQTTFFFYAGVTYPDIPLTCYTERPFVLGRRQAPSFSVVGDDTSGPSADVVLCEGEDLTLSGTAALNNVTITYDWQQYELNGAGDLELVPVVATSDDEAYFVDVVPASPLDQPTLIEGVATVTYSDYNNSGDFECVVEEPWSFQVLPNPVVDWNIPETHVCSGDNAVVEVALLAGATSLNGVDVEWDWDWDVSTFNNTVHTTEPNDVLDIESEYQSTLSGMFEQDLSVVVTDSYGCISEVSENSFTALEVPELNLERPYVCDNDTLEVLGTGADVYAWSPDVAGLDAALLDAVYFPNYVPTGDSVQTLILNQPTNGDVITLVGQLVYPLDETTTLTCEATTDIALIVFDLPVLDATFASDPAPYCEGDVMNFEDANTEGNPNNISYTYWTSGGLESEDDPSNAISFTLFSEATEFEVTKHEVNLIQGVGTMCSVMESFTFDVIANPLISLEANAGICQDGSGIVSCEISDPDPSFTYDVTWTGSSNVNANQMNGDPFVLEVSSASGITPEPSEPLIFTAYVEDNNGCVSEQESIEVDVLATPILEIIDSLLPDHCSPAQDCMQIALLNEGLDVNLDILYFWDNQPGTTSNSNCVNFTNPTSCPFVDSMNVTVRFAHALESGETLFCLSSTMDSTLVKPTPEPQFTLTTPQACLDTAGGNCVPFVHDTTAYDLCVDDSLSYEWFVTPLGELIQNDLDVENLTTPFPTVCLDTAGVVNLVLEITNAYGCSQTTSNVPYTVRGLPVPELTFSQPSICLPTTVSVLNSSAGASDFSMSIPGYPTYENFLSPLVLDVEYPGYYNAEFSVSNTHTIGSHELTCTVETEYIKAFQGRTPPVAEFAVLPDTMIEYVNPVVEFVNLSEGQIENIWSFGNGEGSSELDPQVEYEAAGTYNAQLLVVNEYGCTDVYTQPIEVFTDLYVYVPTSFTPNNDGLNDAWAPSIIGQDVIAKYDCWVFNRTGHTVFHTNDPNKAWIGGNDLSGEGLHYSGGAEVFVWRIAIKKKDGEGAKVYEGHVTMVR